MTSLEIQAPPWPGATFLPRAWGLHQHQGVYLHSPTKYRHWEEAKGGPRPTPSSVRSPANQAPAQARAQGPGQMAATTTTPVFSPCFPPPYARLPLYRLIPSFGYPVYRSIALAPTRPAKLRKFQQEHYGKRGGAWEGAGERMQG